RTVTFVRLGDGSTTPAGSTVTLVISNVRNPLVNVTTGNFLLQTQTAQAQDIDLAVFDADDLEESDRVEGRDGQGHKVLVCHKGRKTLSIGAPALWAHLAHGDSRGACD